MNGLIILISMVFVAVIVYKITKIKILKYILSPIISLLYGFLLFFVGMGVSVTGKCIEGSIKHQNVIKKTR